MTDYPRDPVQRTVLRKRIHAQVLAEAEHKARALGRSMKCNGYVSGSYVPTAPARHASAEDGCRSDGTTCLCECHDTSRETP